MLIKKDSVSLKVSLLFFSYVISSSIKVGIFSLRSSSSLAYYTNTGPSISVTSFAGSAWASCIWQTMAKRVNIRNILICFMVSNNILTYIRTSFNYNQVEIVSPKILLFCIKSFHSQYLDRNVIIWFVKGPNKTFF
jgi:hypothetical protein